MTFVQDGHIADALQDGLTADRASCRGCRTKTENAVFGFLRAALRRAGTSCTGVQR